MPFWPFNLLLWLPSLWIELNTLKLRRSSRKALIYVSVGFPGVELAAFSDIEKPLPKLATLRPFMNITNYQSSEGMRITMAS